METEDERRARLENDAATKRFRLVMETRNVLARPVMGTIFHYTLYGQSWYMYQCLCLCVCMCVCVCVHACVLIYLKLWQWTK